MKRRDFIKLIGIASGATVTASCGLDKGAEKLIPYLVPPEDEIIPGEAFYYNTTCTECPANCGLSVKVVDKVYNNTHGTYPIKLEGVPKHPINDGTLCIRGQSSITRLYNPDRLKNPLLRDSQCNLKNINWSEAYSRIIDALKNSRQQGYKSFYLSSRTTGSLSNLIDLFCNKTGIQRLPEFEVYSFSTIKEANRILFNKKIVPLYHIENADFLLTIGADIFETFISPVYNAVQFSRAKKQNNLEWFHVEPHVSLTGLQANERFAINPGSETYLLLFLLKNILNQKFYKEKLSDQILESIPYVSLEEISNKTGLSADRLYLLAQQFVQARKPLLITGGVSTGHSSGLETAVLTGLVQWVSGMIDSLVDFSVAENYSSVGTMLDMEQLSHRLQNNEVGVIFISKADPVSMLPSSHSFKENLNRAKLRVGLSDVLNETVKECDIILPLSHALESWGDAEPRKGLKTLIQPVLKPLFDTLSEGDILLQLIKASSGENVAESFQQYVYSQWSQRYGENFAKEFLNKGYHEESASRKKVELDRKSVTEFLKATMAPVAPQRGVISKPVIIISPSIRFFDGRSSVLPLLNEIPDPLTTISYGEWISVSEKTAKSMGLKDGDEILISRSDWSIKLPAKIQVALQEDVYMIQLGSVDNLAFQVDKRTGEGFYYLDKITIAKMGSTVALPILSGSMSQEGRGIIPGIEHMHEYDRERKTSLYPKHEHKDYRWAMTIDLEHCIGCSACVAACYIENNVPVVGKEDHLKGLEMSWIRIEPYYEDDNKAGFIPMLCQQCDNAPCESVCPVYATYHNPEGLNAQIYNRCVGTRYCSNNCPYKVRRFNWFEHDWETPLDKMLNPDVFVRTKGIMEKCTFCVQRIRKAHDTAKDGSRKIHDGEVVPACAQTCPTNAIVFGNILDEESRVSELAHSKRAYRVFEHLGTEPSVYYLRRKGKI